MVKSPTSPKLVPKGHLYLLFVIILWTSWTKVNNYNVTNIKDTIKLGRVQDIAAFSCVPHFFAYDTPCRSLDPNARKRHKQQCVR